MDPMKLLSIIFTFICFAEAGCARQPDVASVFQGKEGCFLLADAKSKKTLIEFNKERCGKRVSPCSTFKIPLALMAFDQHIFTDENTLIKWDSVDRHNKDWNKNQTPKTWLKFSSVWVSQWLTPQLGTEKIKKYLADFDYGNQDMSAGITQFWLSSSLKISPREQLIFLERLWEGNLAVSSSAIALTKISMDTETSKSGSTISGKTGTGFFGKENSQLGWYIGYLKHGKDEYIFVTNLEAPSHKQPAGITAKILTRKILSELGLF